MNKSIPSSKSEIKEVKIQDRQYVYYELMQYNNTNQPVAFNFTDTRTKPIIDDPSKWIMEIVRFEIPLDQVYIFQWQGNSYFSVTLTYGTDNYQTYLIYVPVSSAGVEAGNYVWSYQQLADLINTALSTSFTALKTAHGGVSSTLAPFIVYTNTSQIFSLYVPQTYVADSISVYFNAPLYSLFNNFNRYHNSNADPNGKDYEIIVEDLKVNSSTSPTGYYIMSQEYSSLYFMNDLNTIVLKSLNLSTRDQYVPSQIVGNSSDATQRIISDFQIQDLSSDAGNSRSFAQYQPSQYRELDLLGTNPLKIVDIQGVWKDNANTETPIYLSPGYQANVLIRFKRRLDA